VLTENQDIAIFQGRANMQQMWLR